MTRSKKSTRGSLLAKDGIRRQPAKFKRVGPASPAAQAPADLDECLQRLRSLRVEDMADGAAQFIEKIGSLMYKILAAEARGVVDSAFVSRAVDAQGNVLNEGMKVLPLPRPTPTPQRSVPPLACAFPGSPGRGFEHARDISRSCQRHPRLDHGRQILSPLWTFSFYGRGFLFDPFQPVTPTRQSKHACPGAGIEAGCPLCISVWSHRRL